MKKRLIFLALCWMPLFAAEAVTQVFDRGVTLQTVKEEDGFMQYPWSLDINEKGQILVADVLARKIFVWDAGGNYKTSFGKEGHGPGEFMFTGRGSGGYQAYVAAAGRKVYVYDGSERRLSIFDDQFLFERSVRLTLGGRTESFFVTRAWEVLLFQRNYQSEVPATEIAFFGTDGVPARVLTRQEDLSFSRIVEGGKLKNVVYHAFGPTMFLHYDRKNDEILVGNTGKAFLEIFDGKGQLTGSLPLQITPVDVSDQDRREYLDQFWLKDSNFLKADFPDRKSYYDKVLPLGAQHFFVYYQSPVEKRIEGQLLNRQGTQVGKRIRLTCGEGGGLFGASGRIMMIRLDTNDEYIIQELSLP